MTIKRSPVYKRNLPPPWQSFLLVPGYTSDGHYKTLDRYQDHNSCGRKKHFKVNEKRTCTGETITGVSRITGAIKAVRYVGTGSMFTASSVVLSAFIHIYVLYHKLKYRTATYSLINNLSFFIFYLYILFITFIIIIISLLFFLQYIEYY